MYNQYGGNVIWNNDSHIPTWKELPGQEYSVLEKNLLIKLNAIPDISNVTKTGRNKGRVKDLDKWWNNPNETYPMTTSFHNLIKDKSFDEFAEISSDLTEIIDRREQDRFKLMHLHTDKAHDNYLDALKSAREHVRNVLIELTRKKHETTQHIRSPLRISPALSSNEASKLSHSDTSKLSYSATEFVPTLPQTMPVASYQPPTYPEYPTYPQYPQPPTYPHLHPMFNSSVHVLLWHESCGYYWLNKETNETFYATPNI
jgi:hypothetical protein